MRKNANWFAWWQKFGNVIKELLVEFPDSARSYIKGWLERGAIENEKTKAETKKLNAEAEDIAANTRIKEVQLLLIKGKIAGGTRHPDDP